MKRAPVANQVSLFAEPQHEQASTATLPEVTSAFASLGECEALITNAPPDERQDLIKMYRGAHAKRVLVDFRLAHGCSVEEAADAVIDLLDFVNRVDRFIRSKTKVST